MNNKQQVRFAPTRELVVVVDRTKGIEDKLWYSSDNVEQFKLYSSLYARKARNKIGEGSFDGNLDNILGLEKLICRQNCSARRAVLKAAVFEEQAFQRLSRELRLRRGLGDVDSHGTKAALLSLARVAEKNSRWARERAHVAGLALQSDLCSGKLAELKQAKRQRPIQQSSGVHAETSFMITKRPREDDAEESSGSGASPLAIGRPCHRGRFSSKVEDNDNIGEEADRSNEAHLG